MEICIYPNNYFWQNFKTFDLNVNTALVHSNVRGSPLLLIDVLTTHVTDQEGECCGRVLPSSVQQRVMRNPQRRPFPVQMPSRVVG